MNVVNKYHGRLDKTNDVRVMRPHVLGNPFVIGKDGTRTEVIAQYQKWLAFMIKVEKNPVIIAALMAIPDNANLVCCCAPQPCHADIIIKACAWIKKHPVC